MFRLGPSILTLTVALAGAADAPPPDPLDIIHSGGYSSNVSATPTARILNWNIDRGQHFQGIVAAMRDTRPDLCIFQEVDFGARRTRGQDVARELAQTFGMNYTFAPEFRELGQSTAEGSAFHGQAILTRFPIRASRILRFK
jgi:endonuclease/exonuclease/phosphatase family metal-dependent hydrolase